MLTELVPDEVCTSSYDQRHCHHCGCYCYCPWPSIYNDLCTWQHFITFWKYNVLGRSTLRIESFLRNWDPRAKKYKWPRIFCQLANIFVEAACVAIEINKKRSSQTYLFDINMNQSTKIRTVWKPRLKVRVVELLAAVDQREVILLRILIILVIYILFLF